MPHISTETPKPAWARVVQSSHHLYSVYKQLTVWPKHILGLVRENSDAGSHVSGIFPSAIRDKFFWCWKTFCSWLWLVGRLTLRGEIFWYHKLDFWIFTFNHSPDLTAWWWTLTSSWLSLSLEVCLSPTVIQAWLRSALPSDSTSPPGSPPFFFGNGRQS